MATENKLFGSMKADGVDINNISNTPNETAQKIINGEYKKEYEIEKLVQQSNSVSSNSSNNKEDEIKTTNVSTIQDDDLVWVNFDDNNFWFTKQEILLGFIIIVIAIVSIFLIYRHLLYRKFNEQKSTQNNTNKKSKKKYIVIVALLITFLFLHLTTKNATILFFSIFITAISYNFIPCILKFVMKKEYDKRQSKKIAIINAIIIYVLFRILELEMYGTINTHNWACIVWGYVSYCILSYTKKKPQEENLLPESFNKIENEIQK